MSSVYILDIKPLSDVKKKLLEGRGATFADGDAGLGQVSAHPLLTHGCFFPLSYSSPQLRVQGFCQISAGRVGALKSKL